MAGLRKASMKRSWSGGCTDQNVNVFIAAFGCFALRLKGNVEPEALRGGPFVARNFFGLLCAIGQ
jgi:hypothetical protein